ncbi:dehydroadipyl-CoA hydratase-like protein [Emericellopsis cladophorae]|uniref:Dehydroadipyl-CoA hydratase-like protein n=1 Tax=Emericellopsis cladophorae TaxID=2686198 RepID=A0A9P9Y477_9HYPO|nr:dehydroadipyl-CoA hydratase-like protein [Emericellopsis cladophorae]KAI6783328.1 dehydroadipyl-CoA hydratase-like protein [Emericellopsis cladophorae]
MPDLPPSYSALSLPGILLSHHPASSPTPTPVIILALHRPAARNGFTDELAASLITAFDTLSRDDRVKAIVLTSSDKTNRIFCAGMDFNAKGERVSPTAREHRDGGGTVTLAMHNCHKPIVAAINGSAVGVGITMTLPCAIRVASKDAKVGFVFAQRGFNMEACSSFYLPRLVGTSRALHLVTTGAVYPATSPLFSELFSDVVPADEVLPTALGYAEGIARNVSTVAARVMRDMIYRGPRSPEEAHLLESRVFFDLYHGADSKEGVASFLEKRPPKFGMSMERDAPSAWPWWDALEVRSKARL